MTMRRQRCTECGSVFYTQDPKRKICGECVPDAPAPTEDTPPSRPNRGRVKRTPEPQAATAAPDATE